MAKYDVECTSQTADDCEGTFRVDLVGSHDKREWKLENYDWRCDACKQAEREQKNAAAAERNAERGLPELEGTEKQVPWAETIRDDKIDELDEAETNVREAEPDGDEQRILKGLLLEEIERIRTETDAGWWIDHRRRRLWSLIRRTARERLEDGERPQDDLHAFVEGRLGDDPFPTDLMDVRDAWVNQTGADPDEALRQIHEVLNADA